MVTQAERNAIEKRANAKFWPWDTASFSNLLIAFCIIWQVISFWSNVGIVIIVGYLWKQDDDAYSKTAVRSYAGNNLATYGGNPRDGYLPQSNVPKQILAMGFLSIFYLGILIMVFILGTIDLCLLFKWAQALARSMRLTGLNISEYSEQQSIIAIAFLKLWVGVCVGTQSFIAFGEGNGQPQVVMDWRTWHGRFIVTLFVWAYCLNGLIYIATTYCLARRMMIMKKQNLKGFFITHEHKESLIGLSKSKQYSFHKRGNV